MGVFDSKSTKQGGQVGSSDTLANDNSYAAAPVLNLADERKGSGKYVTQAANQYNIDIKQTDYGAIRGALEFADNAFFTASDNLAQMNADYLASVEAGNHAAHDTLRELNQRSAETYQSALKEVSESSETALHYLNSGMGKVFGALDGFAYLLRDTQTEALEQVAQSGAQAQAASEKAMDIAFQASQSEAERLTETSIKFLVGAAAVTAVATMAMPGLLKLVK